MKHCPQCNLDFPDSFRFCGSCGGSLSDSRRCSGCGELTEGKWTFCTSCGKPLSSDSTSDQAFSPKTPEPANLPAPPSSSPTPRTPPPQTLTLPPSEQPTATGRQRSETGTPQEWYSAPDLFEETTATSPAPPIPRQDLVPKTMAPTAQVIAPPPAKEERSAPSLTMLSAYGEPEAPYQFRWWHGAILGLFFLLLLGGLGFGGWYWWSHRGSVAQITPPADSNTSPPATNSSTSPSSKPTSTIASGQMTTSRSVDEEIKRLRERRIGAKPSETSEIISAFEDAEKKYPNDYRFPYERAKLSIKGITSHHEAFGALALAAAKAIDNGKAQEMLDSLMADKDGDFYKVSRGHHEWQALVQALGNKDKRGLNALGH
jgi:Double zinc ribbon